jgi:hypothetical protein
MTSIQHLPGSQKAISHLKWREMLTIIKRDLTTRGCEAFLGEEEVALVTFKLSLLLLLLVLALLS